MSLVQPITRAEAAAELLRRRRARESLVDYALSIDIPGAPVSDDPDEWLFKPIETSLTRHHLLFLRELQACIEKPYGRLAIMAPPGSAKSTYVGPVACSWAMGRAKGFKVVSVSHSLPPALRSARRAQQIARSPAYQAIFNTGLMRGNAGAEEWSMTNDSTLASFGILGGITSTRADLGIIDDPVATRQDADSETVRRNIRQEYEDSFTTRLKPDASVVIIMTRWHEDDLLGSILPSDYHGQSGDVLCRDGLVWRVINLPAQAEHKDDPLGRKPGEMLWPEWFTEKHWSIFRANARTWSALYQQRPAPDSGGQFERKDFIRYKDTPKGLRWYNAGDYAVTELTISDRPDFTDLGAFGINADGDIYCEDGWYGQDAPDVTIEKTIDLIVRFQPVEQLIEKGVILNAMQGALTRRMRERKQKGEKALCVIEPMASNKDKIAKVAAFRARAKLGKVYVKEGPWGDRLIAQLCSFPFGRYDDAVDMVGMIGRRVDDMFAPRESVPVKKQAIKPFSAAMLEAVGEHEEDQAARRRRFMR